MSFIVLILPEYALLISDSFIDSFIVSGHEVRFSRMPDEVLHGIMSKTAGKVAADHLVPMMQGFVNPGCKQTFRNGFATFSFSSTELFVLSFKTTPGKAWMKVTPSLSHHPRRLSSTCETIRRLSTLCSRPELWVARRSEVSRHHTRTSHLVLYKRVRS